MASCTLCSNIYTIRCVKSSLKILNHLNGEDPIPLRDWVCIWDACAKLRFNRSLFIYLNLILVLCFSSWDVLVTRYLLTYYKLFLYWFYVLNVSLSSRPWLCYWILHAITLLGECVEPELEDNVIEFLSHCQVCSLNLSFLHYYVSKTIHVHRIV